MKKRYFAFGCSYTYFSWATYADLIGVNFEKFYNFGAPGASNRQIANKVFEVNEYYDLNPETDFVTIMTTGFNRFSWFNTKDRSWNSSGDLGTWRSPGQGPGIKSMTGFLENMWNDEWAVYESYLGLLSAKRFLEAKGIEHKILKGIPFNFFGSNSSKVREEFSKFIENMEQFYDFKETLHDLKIDIQGERGYIFGTGENGLCDGHPTIASHLAYIEKYLPDYYTEKTIEFAKKCEDSLILDDRNRQAYEWTQFSSHEKKFRFPLPWSHLLMYKNK